MEVEHITQGTLTILMEVCLDNDVEVVIVMEKVMIMDRVMDMVMDRAAEITVEDIDIRTYCLNEYFLSFQLS